VSFEDIAHRMHRDPNQPILLSDLFPSREYNPWLPPGYYVARTTNDDGACVHCGALLADHTGPERFCPRAPLELGRAAPSLPPAA
jgi:hypothetical protein